MLEAVEQKGLSQRAACRWSGTSRAVSRYKLRRPAQDAECLQKMRTAAKANPRYGYRRVAVVSAIGFGRAWRLWKRYGFKIEAQRTRKPRKQDKMAAPLPQQAAYPNHVWTYDILFDRLADGRPFKTLSVLDEFTRECLGILAATSIHAEDVVAFLSGILQQRNAPVFLRSDNGSEFTAEAVQTWLADKKVGPAFIPPGQPWKNGFIESFHIVPSSTKPRRNLPPSSTPNFNPLRLSFRLDTKTKAGQEANHEHPTVARTKTRCQSVGVC
jgi:transposase InsO family protein